MAKLTPRQKQAKALELAQRASGVTANEFASAVSVKTVGPMSMVLKRLVKDGLLRLESRKRDGKEVYKADKNATLPRGKKKTKKAVKKKMKKRGPSKKSKAPKRASSAKRGKPGPKPKAKAKSAKPAAKRGRKPGPKPKAKAAKPAAKRGRKPGRKPAAKKVSSAVKPLELALELGKNSKGFTIYDLAKARGTTQIGPFKRTVNKGVKTNVLKIIGQDKEGKDLYVTVEGASVAVKKPAAKRGRKPGRKKPGPKPKAAGAKRGRKPGPKPKTGAKPGPKPKAKKAATKSTAALASKLAGAGNSAAVADLLESLARVLRG